MDACVLEADETVAHLSGNPSASYGNKGALKRMLTSRMADSPVSGLNLNWTRWINVIFGVVGVEREEVMVSVARFERGDPGGGRRGGRMI